MRFLLSLSLLAFAGPLAAQPKGDIGRGEEIAQRVCTECHAVGREVVMQDFPPSFAAIAVYRDDRQVRARIWAPPGHASMPAFAEILFPSQVEDLVAYIRSLEPKL